MILEKRWKLFGHTLRLPLLSLPQLPMERYYINSKSSKGTPRTTLPVSLNRELLKHTQIKISSPQDFLWIRMV